MSTAVPHEELLSSVVSDIRAYHGDDPLRPWLRGIRRMRQCLPKQTLVEKLPRFLQKCAESFETNRRYRDDPRYLQVWMLLMDHVDDPRGVFRRMEENRIGMKHTAFYVACAWYYEKRKMFEKAEKMYHQGARNLAEPAAELQKSYEQFIIRMKQHKKRLLKLNKMQADCVVKPSFDCQREINRHVDDNSAGMTTELTKVIKIQNQGETIKMAEDCQSNSLKKGSCKKSCHTNMMESQTNSAQGSHENPTKCTIASRGKSILKTRFCPVNNGKAVVGAGPAGLSKGCINNSTLRISTTRATSEDQRKIHDSLTKQSSLSSDDTVVINFVDSAIVGKSEAEDACHHGLVDPTVNMKEAINAINSMFREPLEPEPSQGKSLQNRFKKNAPKGNELAVFIDENLEEGVHVIDKIVQSTQGNSIPTSHPMNEKGNEKSKPFAETFKILADDEEESEHAVQTTLPRKSTQTEQTKPFIETFKILADSEDESYVDKVEAKREGSTLAVLHDNASLISEGHDLPSGGLTDWGTLSSEYVKLKDDTVICNFVGSTVSSEREVEDACHHGLVDPTVNLKAALDDINSMFGKPIDFMKGQKLKKRQLPVPKQLRHGFTILVDEDVDIPTQQSSVSCSTRIFRESDLLEPTVFTKEAMADINMMFGAPLDF